MEQRAKLTCKTCQKEFELEISQDRFDWLKGYIERPEDRGKDPDDLDIEKYQYKMRHFSQNSLELFTHGSCFECTKAYFLRDYSIVLKENYSWKLP
jgi:hypothetical protein